MHDKVLAMIRETLLHENTVERIEVNLPVGEVLLDLVQTNEKTAWPDHRLRGSTFSGVEEFSDGRTP